VLLTQSHLAAGLPPHEAQVLLLDDAPESGDSSTLDVLAGPEDAAYMIYTSGSTGRPKGALNAHRGIVNRLLWMQSEYRLTPADVVLQKTPFSFDVSVWEFFWPLLAGAKLVMARPGGHRDPAYLVDTIATHGVTVCHFVPSMLREFLSHPDVGRCTSLRDVMASGEALSPDLVAAFQRELPNARLHNLYGPTECAVDVTYWPCPSGPGTSAPQLVPIGRPVANTQIHVLDAKLHALPIGVAGELYIGGAQVGLGYHGRPELTAERFVPDPFTPGGRLYRTGDLARWRTDGTVEYLGRLDFQVKLRGYRIELGEIEQRLAALPGVHGALVTLSEDAALGARLVGYYVAPADGLSPDLAAAELRRDLPDFMVPSALVRLDAWPLSPNGKVDRRALPVPDGGAVAEDAGVAPRTAVERVLCRLLGDALGRAPLGVTTDFFAIGGHSLLATRVVSQASRLFRASLTLRGFFAAPSAAGLAEAVTGVLGGAQAERIATLVEKVQSMSPEDRERLRREQASRTEQA
jgi:amino acid adenylation domain-containing protein